MIDLKDTAKDEHGKIAIYLKTSKMVVKVYTVDAKEIIASGEGTFDIPTQETATPDSGQVGEVVDFNSYTVPELKAFAEIAGIENAKAMLKPELVEALTTAKFVPDSGQVGEK